MPTRLNINVFIVPYIYLSYSCDPFIFYFFVRQQVGNGAHDELYFYVMPCGGAVDAEVTRKGETIISRKQIYGYEMLRVKNPALRQRFFLRISASKSEELHRISTVEVSTV
jgi:hypothetical protein